MTKKIPAWFRIPLELASRKDLSSNTKLVYAYMLWRYQFFVDNLDKEYFESQDSIAAALDITRKTVNVAITSLCNAGLLQITEKKKKTGPVVNNYYQVFDVYKCYEHRENSLDW